MSIKTSYTGISPEDLNLINDYIDSVEKYVLKRYPAHIAQQIIKEERMFIFDDIDLSDTLGKEPDVPFIVGRRKELLNDHLSRYNDDEIVFVLPPVLKWISNIFISIFDLILIFFIWLGSLFGGKEKANKTNKTENTQPEKPKRNENTPESQNLKVGVKTTVRMENQETSNSQHLDKIHTITQSYDEESFDYENIVTRLDSSGKFILKINHKKYRKLLSFKHRLISVKFIILSLLMGFSLYYFLGLFPYQEDFERYMIENYQDGSGIIFTSPNDVTTLVLSLGFICYFLILLSLILKFVDYRYWKRSKQLVQLWNLYAVPVTYSQIIYELPKIKVKQTLKYLTELVYRGIIDLKLVEVVH